MIRPCPECGEARPTAILDEGNGQLACVTCGSVYEAEVTLPEGATLVTPLGTIEVERRAKVIKRGTRKADGPKGGCL